MSPVNPAALADGKIMPMEQLTGRAWYVESVEGTIPK